MSQDIVLYTILEKTFAVLLENVEFGDNCIRLVSLLNKRNDEIRQDSDFSSTSLDHLVSGTRSLLRSFDTLKDSSETQLAEDSINHGDSNGEISKPEAGNTSAEIDDVKSRDKAKQPNDSKVYNERLPFVSKDAKLQTELRLIKDGDTFKKAMTDFRKVNESAVAVLEDNERDLNLRITAVQLSVISKILGNLTDLNDAMNSCMKYILRLHQSLSVQDTSMKMYTLFCFMKEFTGKPVAMLDWPMISGRGVEKHHPILGELPTTFVYEPPDPFTYITGIHTKKVQIESSISAINCTGDIFARDKESTDIIKVTPKYKKWYRFDEDHDRKIISISIDCSDCKTKSDCAETSTKSSPNLFRPACRGKMYILVRSQLNKTFRYYLYITDLNGGKKVHEEELGFLERNASEVPKVKMFSIHDKRIVILDVTRRVIHVCDAKGMERNTLDATAYMSNITAFRPPVVTYNSGMICLESRMNFFSKINVYNIITDEEDSCLKWTNKSEVKRAVQAVAFNQESGEIVILCYNVRLQCYLTTYKDGQLMQDIKLRDFTIQALIFNPSGSIVLLDDSKVLHLK